MLLLRTSLFLERGETIQEIIAQNVLFLKRQKVFILFLVLQAQNRTSPAPVEAMIFFSIAPNNICATLRQASCKLSPIIYSGFLMLVVDWIVS